MRLTKSVLTAFVVLLFVLGLSFVANASLTEAALKLDAELGADVFSGDSSSQSIDGRINLVTEIDQFRFGIIRSSFRKKMEDKLIENRQSTELDASYLLNEGAIAIGVNTGNYVDESLNINEFHLGLRAVVQQGPLQFGSGFYLRDQEVETSIVNKSFIRFEQKLSSDFTLSEQFSTFIDLQESESERFNNDLRLTMNLVESGAVNFSIGYEYDFVDLGDIDRNHYYTKVGIKFE